MSNPHPFPVYPVLDPTSIESPTTLALRHRESAEKSIFVINPTGECNLRCIHCWNARYVGTELDLRTVCKVIDLIPAHVRIHFLGGEPLLHPDILELLAYSRRSGHYTSLVTNGLLVPRMGVDRLLESGLSEVGVSIDGTEEINDKIRGRGSYSRALNALTLISRYIVARGMDVKLLLSVTAMSKNVSSIPVLIENIAQSNLHIDKVIIDRVVQEGRAMEVEGIEVRPETWLDMCEQICARWKHYRTIHHLTLKVPPLVHHYLTSKYHVFLRDSIIGCPGLESPLGGCLTSDGRVYSCSREFLIRRAKKQGYLPLQGEKYLDLVRMTGSIFRLPDFVMTLGPFLKSPDDDNVCLECEWKSGCRVKCPIRTLLGDGYSANLCREALRRMAGKAVARSQDWPNRSASDRMPQTLEETSTFLFRNDVYVKQRQGATTVYFSPGLDKMVTFPADMHAEFLLDRSNRAAPLAELRKAYRHLHNVPGHYLDLVIWRLICEGFVEVHPADIRS